MTNHNSPQPTEQPEGNADSGVDVDISMWNHFDYDSQELRLSVILKQIETSSGLVGRNILRRLIESTPSKPGESVDALAKKANGYGVYAKGSEKYNAFNEGFAEGYKQALASHSSPSVDAEPSPQEAVEFGWVSDKPDFKEECTFVTATKYQRNSEPLYWDYTVWQIKQLDGENDEGEPAWYWGLLNGEGEEWGPLDELAADMYLIIPSPSTK